MSEKDIVNLALECIESCINIWGPDSEELKRLRARARSIGSEYMSKGLAYTITLLAARSNREAIEVGLNANSCKDVVDGIQKLREQHRLGLEELSYALYGAILAFMVKKLGLTNAVTFGDFLRHALSSPALELRVFSIIEWIKRMTEAYVYASR